MSSVFSGSSYLAAAIAQGEQIRTFTGFRQALEGNQALNLPSGLPWLIGFSLDINSYRWPGWFSALIPFWAFRFSPRYRKTLMQGQITEYRPPQEYLRFTPFKVAPPFRSRFLSSLSSPHLRTPPAFVPVYTSAGR